MQKNGGGFLTRIIKGLAIGVAAMLPGASGGVLAVAMGVYRPALDAVTGLFKSFMPCFMYLLPLGIGGVVGLIGTGRVMESILAAYRVSAMWALIGMVLGGIPSLIGEANRRGFKPRYLLGTLAGAALIGGFCSIIWAGERHCPSMAGQRRSAARSSASARSYPA